MKTKHEGYATAFERLDREILALRKGLILGELFAHNWAGQKLVHPPASTPLKEIGRAISDLRRIFAACWRLIRYVRVRRIVRAIAAAMTRKHAADSD